MVIEARWADGRTEQLALLVSELLNTKLDVLVTYGTPAAIAAKDVTSTVPIVGVAMGEPLGDGAWSLRLQYKPMVRFIWLGALVIAIGGFIAVCDRRYRQRVTADATNPAQADTSAA